MTEPTDARLAALYDADNPSGPDHDFFRSLADRLDPQVIVDLGCGTGLLTVTLASARRTTIGIDPDAGMLDVARTRPGGERVQWRLGDSRQIDCDVDLALMTGNVVQHIRPPDWDRTLVDIAAALREDGAVAFDYRNPTAAAWRDWTRERTVGTRPTDHGPLTEWLECTEPDEHGTVVLTAGNRWEATGEELIVRQPLTFRSLEALEHQLASVGLSVSCVWGGWHGEPFDGTSPVMIIEARPS